MAQALTRREVDRKDWPALPFHEWQPTLETLHRWLQVLGKIRLECSPWINHSWSVPFYVTPSGLTSGTFPYGSRALEIRLDFINSQVSIDTATGQKASWPLAPMAVADFWAQSVEAMRSVQMPIELDSTCSEIPDSPPLDSDITHSDYEADHARALWRALVQSTRVFTEFRAGFVGKVSPVHLFWGGLDLAVTRFSGRTAPPHSASPAMPLPVAQEAYSHEVSSLGFWPGSVATPEPVFYSYAYPMPQGFADAAVAPKSAQWSQSGGEFVMAYEAVRSAADPDRALFEFAQSTYDAAADLANWNRDALEWSANNHGQWWASAVRGSGRNPHGC